MFGIKGGSRIEWSESRWTKLDRNLDYTISLVFLSKWLVQKFDESCPNAPLLHCFWGFGVCHLGRWHADMEKKRKFSKHAHIYFDLRCFGVWWLLFLCVVLLSIHDMKKMGEIYWKCLFMFRLTLFTWQLCVHQQTCAQAAAIGASNPTCNDIENDKPQTFPQTMASRAEKMGNSWSNGGRRFSDWVCGLFVRLGNVIWNFLDFDLINFVSRHVCPMLLLKINIYICPSLHQPWLRTSTCKSRCERELVSIFFHIITYPPSSTKSGTSALYN